MSTGKKQFSLYLSDINQQYVDSLPRGTASAQINMIIEEHLRNTKTLEERIRKLEIKVEELHGQKLGF